MKPKLPFTEIVSATSTDHGFRVVVANGIESAEFVVGTSELLNFRKFCESATIRTRRPFQHVAELAGDAAQDRWSEAMQAALAVGRRKRAERGGKYRYSKRRKAVAAGVAKMAYPSKTKKPAGK